VIEFVFELQKHAINQMVCRIFVTGLIRPSALDVIEVILKIRSQIPDAITYLCTWTNQDVSRVKDEVDHCIQIEEPDTEEIRKQITATTKTDNNPGAASLGWPYMTYRMFTPVNALIDYANPADDDIIVRIRTDSVFLFHPDHLKELLNAAKTSYVARSTRQSGVGFSDWFAISNFKDFKTGWYFRTMDEYNKMLQDTWNTEDVIRWRLLSHGVTITPIREDRLHCYLIRPGPTKHYHDDILTDVVVCLRQKDSQADANRRNEPSFSLSGRNAVTQIIFGAINRRDS
jgi:hypothetical protein